MLRNAFKDFLLYIIGFAAAGLLFSALGQAISYGDYKKSDLIWGLFVPPSIKIFFVLVSIGVVIGVFYAIFQIWRAMSKR